MAERLDKFISEQTGVTRSEARTIAASGRVSVNGASVRGAALKISPETDKIALDGKDICYRKYIYLMLNKPAGVVCSTKDGDSPTVLSLVPEEYMRKGLFPAGRLDKDTEGFVLLTDDGELSHRLLSPKKHVPKLYYARLEKPYKSSYEDVFASGMRIDGGDVCLPAKIVAGKNKNECFITLNEGMFHQVKRMVEAVGNKVVYLRRERIGGLNLDHNLPIGECREISTEELALLCTI